MALTVTSVPGKQLASTEAATVPKLNQLGRPTFQVSGTLSNSEIASGAVSAEKSQADNYWFATTAGSSTVYTLDLGAGLRPDALADGVIVRAKLHVACGNAPTLNVTGSGGALGAKSIRKPGDVVVSANDYANNQVIDFTYNSSYNSSAGAWVAQSISTAPPIAIAAESRNLVIKNNAGTPNTQVDIVGYDGTGFEIILTDSSNFAVVRRTAATITINTALNGANGMDTGGLAANTWYYVYLIFNPTGGTLAGIMSLNALSPAMPADYTYKALIAVIRTRVGAAEIRKFWQTGRRLHWGVGTGTEGVFITAFAGPGVNTWVAASAAVTPTNVISALVPPIAKTVFGTMGESSTATNCTVGVAGDGTELYGMQIAAGLNSSATQMSFGGAAPFEVPIITTQDFYWTGDTGAVNRIVVSGHTI